MRKIFIAFSLLAFLFFPKSEILAQGDLTDPSRPGGIPGATNNTCTFCPADTTEIQGACLRNVGMYWTPVTRSVGCPIGKVPSPDINDPNCRCISSSIDCSKEENKAKCTGGKGVPCPGSTNGGIETAIGCVPTEPKALVEGLLKFGTLAAGGIAFLLMLLGALQMITAEGNPESIKHAQERFYSAIIGLLLIIFAVLLMQVIGVDILGIPELRSPLPPNEIT